MVGNIVYLMCISIIIYTEGYVIKNNEFELSIVHFNDVHARFDEVSKSSGPCKLQNGLCHGGFARLYSSVMDLMSTQKNPILLDAGDDYQGTLYYNLFKWNITHKFLNLFPITAHTLGNHEFDDGIAGLVPFLKVLKAPMIVANLDDSLVPEMQGLYKKSIVTTVEGKKIGIVGVTSSRTPELSSPGKLLKFLDELESMNKEAKRLIDEEDVFTVIILSHCGYEVDQILAKGASEKISLIVGAHSHTLLYTGTPPDGSVAEGPYPTLVPRDIDGVNVLIVQASAYTRYLGNISVVYSENGDIVKWSGNPVYLGPEVIQDDMIVEEMKPWKAEVEAVGNEVLGSTLVTLSSSCRSSECNFGNFIADSIVFSYTKDAPPGCWTRVALALCNAGGIRTSIPIGNITFNDIMIAQPFENTFDSGLLKGKYIRQIFDRTTTPFKFRDEENSVNLLQVSGFRVEYDLSKPEGERVISLKLRSSCSEQYEDLDPEKTYRIAFLSFLGKGGDGHTVIPDNIEEYEIGELDSEVLRRYVTHESPITIEKEGRLVFHGPIRPIAKRR